MSTTNTPQLDHDDGRPVVPPSATPPTIGDRLTTVTRHVAVIAALAATDLQKLRGMHPDDIVEHMRRLALDAHEELFWVMQLPPRVLATPAPDDDQLLDLDEDTARGLR